MGCSKQLKLLTQLVTVEAFVANHAQPCRVSQQWENMVSFISLSFDEQQVHCEPTPVSEGHDLGVAASTCLAHGLLVCATRRIGGTLMNHHMRAIHQPDAVSGFAGDHVEHALPEAFASPLPMPAIDGAPRTKTFRQVTPGTRVAQPVEQAFKHKIQRRSRSTAIV